MSIKSALIGSAIGLGISGLTCSGILEIIKRINKDDVENVTISRQFTPLLFEQIGNVIVVTSGLFGLYYGMKNDIKLLRI